MLRVTGHLFFLNLADLGPDFAVGSIVAQPTAQILASGWFSSVGGQPRSGIARLNPHRDWESLELVLQATSFSDQPPPATAWE